MLLQSLRKIAQDERLADVSPALLT